MEIGIPLTREEVAKRRYQERARLERIVGADMTVRIENIIKSQKRDALQPIFETIPFYNRRLRAAASAELMMAIPSVTMGVQLRKIASDALAKYQQKLTPMGERAASALCLDILKDSYNLEGYFVQRAIAENLLDRLKPAQTSSPINMTRTVRAQTRALLRDFFAERPCPADDYHLAQLYHESLKEDVPINPPFRMKPVKMSTHGNVVTLDFSKRKGGPA